MEKKEHMIKDRYTYMTEAELTAGSEMDRRQFLSTELYRALESVSHQRAVLIHIYDMVPKVHQEPDSSREREMVRISVLFTYDSQLQKYSLLIEMPAAGNETAITLHGNELRRFIMSKLQFKKGDVVRRYVPAGSLQDQAEREGISIIHLPHTVRPKTKNYALFGRNKNGQPEATMEEVLEHNDEWLDEVYEGREMEYPNITLIAYFKKQGELSANHVGFKRIILGEEPDHEDDVTEEFARRSWQLLSLPVLHAMLRASETEVEEVVEGNAV